MTEAQLQSVKDYILQTGQGRRDNGVMGGDLLKSGKPNKARRDAELEYMIGAYTCFTKMMAIVDDISHDDAMKYFPPAVMFAGLRGDSVLDIMEGK